jgi:hypothetical protein
MRRGSRESTDCMARLEVNEDHDYSVEDRSIYYWICNLPSQLKDEWSSS